MHHIDTNYSDGCILCTPLPFSRTFSSGKVLPSGCDRVTSVVPLPTTARRGCCLHGAALDRPLNGLLARPMMDLHT